MSTWVYDNTQAPAAHWTRASGGDAVSLDIPDGGTLIDEGEPGTEEWGGVTVLFIEGKQQALDWLEVAATAVRALPEPT